ncbi:MAG: hypothetical protein GXP31_19110 [Kiritimatiellaeota bacterium]|nr:hypothetical protein [Kiritimatiellota bacterium]
MRMTFGLFLMIALGATAAPVPDRPFTADEYTVLLYHFEGSGAEVPDSGPVGVVGRLQGQAVRSGGRFGKGLDTRKGGVYVAHHPVMDLDRELTLEAWIRVDGPGDKLQRIAYRSSVYGLYLDQTGQGLTFYISAGGEWTAVRARVPLKKWTHVAGTYDGKRMRLYVNGRPEASKALTGRLAQSRVPLEIGGEVREHRRFLNGAVDEVRLSEVARTSFGDVLAFEPTVQAKPIAFSGAAPVIPVPEVVIGRVASAPVIDGRIEDPAWKEALVLSLDDTAVGASISQRTTAYLAYDDRAIYVAVRCRETQMNRLTAAVRQHDGPVWNDDCVELFLRPPGSRAYYHWAINALGTVYDARCAPRGDPKWESRVRVGAVRGEKEWTVEAAIPFSAFPGSGPSAGPWRGNVCRERKINGELSSWAPVGGRFHSPGKFGKLAFGLKPTRSARIQTRLVGIVVGPDGQRMAGIPVSSARGVSRTNYRGRFEIGGLPRGRAVLAVVSPRYLPMAVEVTLDRPEERVILPPVRSVDPNTLGTKAPETDGGFVLGAFPPLDDVDPAVLPQELGRRRVLQAFACPGEYESLGAVIVASKPLQGLSVSVSPLTITDGDAVIPAAALDVRLIKRLFVRTHYSRPPEDVGLRSRYLLENAPFDMAADTFRRIQVIAHVPNDAVPGVYRGRLTVTPRRGRAAVLPVVFEVLSLRLDPPRKHYALYYRRNLTPESMPLIRAELADIRAHGADRLLWRPRIVYAKDGVEVAINYGQVESYVNVMLEFGFQGPFIVWDGLEQLARLTDGEEGAQFLAAAKRAIVGLRELGKKRGWPELVVTHMDEVFGRKRLDRFIRLARAVRQVPDQRIYITFHNRPRPGVAEMIREIDPYVDIRCYHGHSIDEWLAAGHTMSELTAELKKSGDEAWCYYNPRSIEVTAEWSRLCNGYWLWLTPITTHCPWAYNSYRGNPLDDADGYDFGYAFPVDGKIVSTRLWEGYREGVDDMRYLSTLENLLDTAAARKVDTAEMRQARAWLDDLRRTLLGLPLEEGPSALVKAMAAKYGAADYDAWRRTAAEYISRLRKGATGR